LANQNASHDDNKVPALTFHAGTAGTSETIRWTGQASGAANVHVTGGTQEIRETSPGTIIAFVTDIPGAGTAVQLASNSISAGVLQAPSTNTGNVYIGASDVSSSIFGAELQPGQSVGFAGTNTNLIYVDAATNGDDVAFLGS